MPQSSTLEVSPSARNVQWPGEKRGRAQNLELNTDNTLSSTTVNMKGGERRIKPPTPTGSANARNPPSRRIFGGAMTPSHQRTSTTTRFRRALSMNSPDEVIGFSNFGRGALGGMYSHGRVHHGGPAYHLDSPSDGFQTRSQSSDTSSRRSYGPYSDTSSPGGSSYAGSSCGRVYVDGATRSTGAAGAAGPHSSNREESAKKIHVDLQLSISRFPDLSFLAQGAMCKCFLARNSRFSEGPVVLKMAIENGPREAERDLKLELSLLQNLAHPNLTHLLGAGKTPKLRTFIVVEYLDNGTLRQRLDSVGGGLGFWPAAKHALELASVMKYMHGDAIPRRCVMHRDLKPDNLGFSGNTLKLFDLGLAKVVRKGENRAKEVYHMSGKVGSLRYMAPEVASARPYNEKVDVHSFAIIVWEMVTGWLPFSRLSPQEFMLFVVENGQRPLVQFQWRPDFKSLLAACWADEPCDRPSFAEICEALERMLADHSYEAVSSNTEALQSAVGKKSILARLLPTRGASRNRSMVAKNKL